MSNPDSTEPTDDQSSFGFKTVPKALRQRLVNDVFSRVASHYDLMNDLMSGGLHRLWKDDLINWLAPPRSREPHRLIDVAGGTGDVALRYAQAAGKNCRAIVCDINAEMLELGRRRARNKAHGEKISFVQGNAEHLPFPEHTCDAYTIAFGIRNVTNIETALTEAYRVLRPGGRFLCLEFSEVNVPGLDRLYDAWSFNAIPTLGRFAADDQASYQDLVESIRKFPNQDTFAAMVTKAGVERVQYRNLTGGIAAIHSGWRI